MTYPALSMIDVIRIGASRRPAPTPCPICRVDPPLSSHSRFGYFSIACPTDGCPTCVEGDTLEGVWENWELEAAGAGGIK
jgi:hypothetical protein